MRQVPVLLALISASFGMTYDGLRVKYGKPGAVADKDAFFEIPRTVRDAKDKNWNKTQQPDGPDGYKSLVMYCPPELLVCALYMDGPDGFVAGLQIAAPVESINATLKPEGYFKNWTVPANGTVPEKTFWTATQYFVSTESLNGNDPPVMTKNSTLQHDGVWVQGLNGTLMKIQLHEAELNKTDFKKQNCVANMGTHYYWNMTKALTCEKQMLPWFPLVKDGEVLGVGFQTFGKKPTPNAAMNETDYYETLPKKREAPLDAIPLAPECFLDASVDYGRLSIHIYYIDNPWNITCTPGDSIHSAAFLSRPAALGQILFGAIYLILRSVA